LSSPTVRERVQKDERRQRGEGVEEKFKWDMNSLLGLGEGGGEVGAAHEVAVEFKRYEIATLPSSGLRAGLSVARNDNLDAGGAAALGDGPVDNHRSLLSA